MKNKWGILLSVGILVILIGALVKYYLTQQSVPLSEIFPDEQSSESKVEYQFVDDPQQAEEAAKKQPPSAEIPAKVPVINPPHPVTAQQEMAPKEETTPMAKVKVPFTIQVGSFKDKKKAENILDGLKKKGYDPYIVSTDLKEKGVWYRIFVGRFEQKGLAEELLIQLKNDYKESFIISPK